MARGSSPKNQKHLQEAKWVGSWPKFAEHSLEDNTDRNIRRVMLVLNQKVQGIQP